MTEVIRAAREWLSELEGWSARRVAALSDGDVRRIVSREFSYAGWQGFVDAVAGEAQR
jgi:hypothetical protein